MTDCIKTGARVYLPDYDVVLPADVFRVGRHTLVFNLNMALFHDRSTRIPQEDITHTIKIDSAIPEASYFWHKEKGILVVTDNLVTTL